MPQIIKASAAPALVLSLGIDYSEAGAINIVIGSVTISLSGLAVGVLAGIVLNAVLPGKDYVFAEDGGQEEGKGLPRGITEKEKIFYFRNDIKTSANNNDIIIRIKENQDGDGSDK